MQNNHGTLNVEFNIRLGLIIFLWQRVSNKSKKKKSQNLTHLSWMGRKEDFRVCVGGESDLTSFSWSKKETSKSTYKHWHAG